MTRVRCVALAAVAWLLLASVQPGFAQTSSWPSEAPPRPLAPHDVKFPPYELRTLPNGMQVVVVMHHEQPAVSMRIIVRAGSAQDPPGKFGVASLAAALLDQGTAARTAAEIADTIDSAGGDSDTGAGRDLSYAHILVMKDSFDLAMNLLADEVRQPSFADAEIERQRQQMLSVLKVSYDDPEYVANVVFDRLVYGFNPYGSPSNGTPDSLPRITRADLQEFHRRWYVPNNCVLAVVGDVTTDEAFAAVSRAFGDWAAREVPKESVTEPPPPTRRVIVVDKPDAVQTEVRVGHLGIPRKQNDYTALDLAMRILGGEGANRLHRVLRMERGLTYGASAQMETLKRAGEFVAVTNTRSEATGEVLRVIVEQFNKLRLERVNPEELEDAKAYLTGNFPLRIETPDDIAMQVVTVLFYDLPIGELQTYRQRVNAVTVDDIERVANAYLRPDRLSVVLVGNAKAFVGQLKAVGFDRYEVIPATAIDLANADLRRHPVSGQPGAEHSEPAPRLNPVALTPGTGLRTPEPPTGTSMDQQAQDLLDRAIRAKGGIERLRALKTVVMTAVTTVRVPKPIRAETTSYIEYPNRFRSDAKLPNGELTQVYAGGQAWMKTAEGVQDIAGAQKDSLRATASRDLVLLLLSAADGKCRLRIVPPTPGQAPSDTEVLEVARDELPPVFLVVNRATGQIAAERYVVEQPGAVGKVQTEEAYSDYRTVDGIQVAFKTTVRRGEAVILERTLTDLKMNVPLDQSLFKRPV